MFNRKVSYMLLNLGFLVSFILLGIFCFGDSYKRLLESIIDLWNSTKFYFVTLFNLDIEVVPTVIDFTKIFDKNIVDNINPLPPTTDEFIQNGTTFFELFWNKENFTLWGKNLLVGLGNFSKIMVIILPILVAIIMLIKQIYSKSNNNYNKDTAFLTAYKKCSKLFYEPIKRYVLGYVEFMRENKYFIYLFIAIWVLNLNFVTIVIEFISYYMYFAVSFQFNTIYTQFCKLFIDLKIGFRGQLLVLFLPLGLWIFSIIRSKIATNKLRHNEAKNCGFIMELPIVSMSVGSMGKKKTTLITDMALSQELMFRQKAFDIIQKCDMKFPHFPWICFENEIKKCMEFGTIYNLASIKQWIAKKQARFNNNFNSNTQLYGYDYVRYGLTYDDKLKVYDLFSVLETYAKAYFIYIIESSLLVANYSIREDLVIASQGNFPMWNGDFFGKDKKPSRFANILDFDTLRLGKKVIENNKNNGSFEFGVVVITEIGKERGNNLELKEVKKGNDTTNQKNDLFNSWLKMCRHSATVDNYPFIKVFTDEQRPESWGADARDLCDIVHIIKSEPQRIAYPFYTLEEMIADWCFSKFINMYYDFRFRRGDNTLLVHLLKQVVGVIYRRNLRMYNKYGYSILQVEKERGTMDEEAKKHKYYLANKKIYSDRFSTDCFSDYFNDLAAKTNVGLRDYIEYATSKASIDELKLQNSYFINSLYKGGDDNE